MLYALKRLALGVTLIVLASSVLLLSDLQNRKTPETNAHEAKIPKVALFAYASSALLDSGMDGVKQALAEAGFIPDKTIQLSEFNAQADMPTANSVAASIVGGGYDMVITVSTPGLQTMAKANKDGKLIHVFGLVTDPFGAGVGINRDNPLDHPRHLAGVGTFQPVKELFQLVKEVCPDLTTVGVVWNPSEACSEACTKLARESCAERGMTLLEANVENTAGVAEAASSLAARGIQAFYIGGDNTVETGIASLMAAAERANLPVFTNTPSDIDRGTTLNLGANYVEVGRTEGRLAASILNGEIDPATVPIKNVVPRSLTLNLKTLAGVTPAWRPSDEIVASADIVINADGTKHTKTAAVAAPTPDTPPKKWNIYFLDYCEADHVKGNHEGFFPKFKELGMVEGRDYEMHMSNAQGDMTTLATMVEVAANAKPDLLLLTSTPTLQAAMKRFKETPIIFSNVANPVVAGAGKTNEDHLPNITGVSSSHDCVGAVAIVKECLPKVKRIGTLFCPAETNSEFTKNDLVSAAQNAGLECTAIPSQTSADVPSAAQALCASGIDAICQIMDNMHDSGFASIAAAAQSTKMPLFVLNSKMVEERGAPVAWARDYESGGQDQAEMAVRVMRGESPANIPFHTIRVTRLVINLKNAKTLGMTIPESLLKRADKVIPE